MLHSKYISNLSFAQSGYAEINITGIGGGADAERLQFERQVLAGLRLPRVARLYDGGTTPGGQPYLVMEYVAGMPLDAYCDRHDLPLPARMALFLQVCDSVSAAHGQLVVHCDLKPANVLVGADGVPVLLDFGVARLLGDASANPGLRMYTPVYAGFIDYCSNEEEALTYIADLAGK